MFLIIAANVVLMTLISVVIFGLLMGAIHTSRKQPQTAADNVTPLRDRRFDYGFESLRAA